MYLVLEGSGESWPKGVRVFFVEWQGRAWPAGTMIGRQPVYWLGGGTVNGPGGEFVGTYDRMPALGAGSNRVQRVLVYQGVNAPAAEDQSARSWERP